VVPEARLVPPEETAIHLVLVPVEERTCPAVPVAPVESLSEKYSVKLFVAKEVEVALVAVREFALTAFSFVVPVTVRLLVLAFPRVLCPVTERVPLDTSDDVAVTEPPVTLPPVSDEKKPVTPCTIVATKPVVVVVAVTVSVFAFS
jgi:hypothetical protein